MPLRHARGRKATMPQLLEGQFAVTKDTEEVFAGINQKNIRVLDEKDKAELLDVIENIEVDIDTSGLATKTELQQAIENVEVDTTNLATKPELQTLVTNKADISYVDGKFGQLGSRFTFKGTTAFADLPTSGMEPGDYWYVSDRTTNYAHNGTSWVDIGNNLKIGQSTISPKNTTFINLITDAVEEEPEEEYVPVDILTDYTGGITEAAIWHVSGKLSTVSAESYNSNTLMFPVTEGAIYRLTKFRGRIFFFDENKVNGVPLTTDVNGTSFTQTIKDYDIQAPAGYSYMGVSMFKASNFPYPVNIYKMTPDPTEETEPEVDDTNKPFEMPHLVVSESNLQSELRERLNSSSSGLPLKGLTSVHFGDSITDLGNYPEVIGNKTGLKAYNVGFAGCRMSRHPTSTYDAFSMTKLADAITSRDFTLQDTAQTTLNYDNYQTLKEIDFTKVDIITIFYGTNDFNGAIRMGEDTEKVFHSFKGAINYTIDKILTVYPHIKLAFISPMWRSRMEAGDGRESDTSPNSSGVYLKDYVDAVVNVANLNHIPALDLYRNGGINKYNGATLLKDGLHPNDAGYVHLGNKISAFLVSQFS